MKLDVYTLFVCELYVLVFLSIIMVFAWRGAQYNRVLGFNCLALTLTMFAVIFSSQRAGGALFLPVFIGNITLMAAYGVLLCAFRSFSGIRCGWSWMPGMAAWALLCLLPAFYHSMPLRIFISCILCVIYTLAMLYELRRSRAMLPVTFWPAQLLLLIHLTFNLLRAALDGGIPSTAQGAIAGSTFSIYVILESILFVIGLSFTMMAMVNERTQLIYRQASLLDPLTGIWNRRALFEKSAQMTASWDCSRHPLCVMLFDLDHFKSINDRYGHAHGDRVLIDFCQLVNLHLPVDSYFARLGGEEFAAVVMCPETEARHLAEQIRLQVENSRPENVEYSVSIGIAHCQPERNGMELLMTAADEALYQAKAAGRNRVETFSPLMREGAAALLVIP